MKISTIAKVCLAAFFGSLLGQGLFWVGMPLVLSMLGRGIEHRNRISETKNLAIELRSAMTDYGVSTQAFSLRDALHDRKFLEAINSRSASSTPVIFISQGPIDLNKPFDVEAFSRLRNLKSVYLNISGPDNNEEPELIDAQ